MPRKLSPDTTYGQKIVALFARLLFSGEWHGLADLARELECSKQTVLRLVDDVTLSYRVKIDSDLRGGRRYWRIRRSVPAEPAAMLTPQEMDALLMCRAFTRHLLGRQGYGEAERALAKTSQLLAGGGGEDGELGAARFGVFRPGSIDYTPFLGFLQTVTEAMRACRVCEAEYRKPGERRSKRFRFKPLKVFSWRETIYVHGRYAAMPGQKFKDPGHDPLWALQRFRSVRLTDVTFKQPADYDFERALNREFGLLRGGERVRVVADFTGWAADYVAEREWSPAQTLAWRPGGVLRLSYDAASVPEVVSWVLSFGSLCRVVEPQAVVDAVLERLREVSGMYSQARREKG
ncbi:MAG: WYL domain-containing protein [Candidatus Krumholzibacteria bacterium]|nr:WYL domain-containing protein [Candidatus Krumholzibacteria bacterium]